MKIELKVPLRFDEPGCCQLCGRKLSFLRRLLGSGEDRRTHRECYESAVVERAEAVEEYRTRLKGALEDGTVTVDEEVSLVDLSHRLQLPESAVQQIRLLVYHDLYQEATADRILDDQEDRVMTQVQAELGISDTDIQPQLSELARLRFLRHIRNGELPVISAPCRRDMMTFVS